MDIWPGKSQHKSSGKFVIGLRQENDSVQSSCQKFIVINVLIIYHS